MAGDLRLRRSESPRRCSGTVRDARAVTAALITIMILRDELARPVDADAVVEVRGPMIVGANRRREDARTDRSEPGIALRVAARVGHRAADDRRRHGRWRWKARVEHGATDVVRTSREDEEPRE